MGLHWVFRLLHIFLFECFKFIMNVEGVTLKRIRRGCVVEQT